MFRSYQKQESVKANLKRSATFTINGQQYNVANVDANMTLNRWMRDSCMTSVKVMCQEGGCGACVVAVRHSADQEHKSVNSCLMPLYAADGCDIVTAEGVGGMRKGYNEIQKRMTEHGATQCGYCTPGFVMSIYSKISSGKQFTEQEMEDHLDGHMCRCTGYRSILDAARSFANGGAECVDIEDVGAVPCPKLRTTRSIFSKDHQQQKQVSNREQEATQLYQPTNLDQVKAIMKDPKVFTDSTVFHCSNTSTGIFKTTGKAAPAAIVDVSQVAELCVQQVNAGESMVVGANTSINELARLMSEQEDNDVMQRASRHLYKVAGNAIRNVASWAGNVMVKYRNRWFPSDVCVVLAGAGATFTVLDAAGSLHHTSTLFDPDRGLFSRDLDNMLIVSLTLPLGDVTNTRFRSYKVAPRSQNTHAYVNAAFRAQMSSASATTFGSSDAAPTIVYGNMSGEFQRAVATEKFLAGKNVLDEQTLKGALKVLEGEMVAVQHSDVDISADSKRDLALGLFYKFYLSCVPPAQLSDKLKSAASSLQRDLSSGTQTYTTNEETYPVSQEIPKISSLIQTSGQAYYQSDQPPAINEIHCAFVLSEVGNADIDQIDDSFASLQPGFVQVITGANFPEEIKNSRFGNFDTTQELLATKHVDYAGQPVALVLADGEHEARSIAAQVVVTYKNEQTPIITTRDAIANNSYYPLELEDVVIGDPDGAMQSAKYKVSGKMDLGGQYHYYMESQIARVESTDEGGFLIESACQVHNMMQQAVSYAYDIPTNKVEVRTKRIGGAYGGKATNSIVVALAAAVGSHVTGRPCRFHLDLKTCMATLGWRLPYSLDYQVGFDGDGLMKSVDWTVYTNSGCSVWDNEADDAGGFTAFSDNAYYCPNRRVRRKVCKTDMASGTWCRAPGSLQLTAFADFMMEHIADHLGTNVVQVKQANLYRNGQYTFSGDVMGDAHISEMYTTFLEKTKVSERQASIETFNRANTFRKRAIAITPMRYPIQWYFLVKYNVFLTVNESDGAVVVSHGGIEVGQGIDTKVVQVVAYGLGIDVGQVVCKRTSTITSSNSEATGGSTTSELVCRSAAKCCEIMVDRMKEVKSGLPTDIKWQDLVQKCAAAGVDLNVSCTYPPPKVAKPYDVWGVTGSEVEVDLLTGEHLIRQVDLVEDCGISMNPIVDVGQVEGAFIMSLGFWLNEHMSYDKKTGRLLTDGTWEYKPPTTKDIPVKWNVEFYKKGQNPVGTYNSKAVGEPPLCMAVSVVHAIRKCVDESLCERGVKEGFTQLSQPLTPDSVKRALKINPDSDFSLSPKSRR